ncbi:hypothetical protein [Dyadobacter sp. 3J3]|uniref:hypothetical protein n=1 Tax=Dyadobacter sp. 3J3 TaxID=2606600 RepID=UPI001359AED5|nr:hypothetical protein [Dyadobacter sp. 3J3]
MEQIILIKTDGTRFPLRRTNPATDITKAEQVKEILGQDVVNISVQSSKALELEIGTKIMVFSDEYTLNYVPQAQKNSGREFSYDLVFEGVQYDLLRSQYFNTDVLGVYTSGEFSLTGVIDIFISSLIYNANRTFGAGKWIKGEIAESDTKTVTFSNLDCLAALQTICQAFSTEFEIIRNSNGSRTINVKKIGQILNDTFSYGKGNGLYELSRKAVNPTGLVNRLYPKGSTENIKAGYRNFSDRLKIGDEGSDYVENAASVAALGIIEGSKNFDEVKPQREGTITAIYGGDITGFVDGTMDFDLNEKDTAGNTKYLIAGTSAKIHFNSGNLAGYEFELQEKLGYVHADKSFHLIALTEKQGGIKPLLDSPFMFAVGDKYVILDINMPDTYVTAAETELRTKGQSFVDANCWPMVSFALKVKPEYLANQTSSSAITNFFSLGDYINIRDLDLGINKATRITSFTRQILIKYQYDLVVSDSYQVNTIAKTINDQRDIQTIIRINDLRNPQKARMNWRTQQELLKGVFDTDGYYDSDKIKPLSIETSMLSVGAKSQQLMLNTVIRPNYQGDKNVVRVDGGSLVHYTIEDAVRNWTINAQTVSLGNDNFYYIYGRCNKTTNAGSILFSQNQIKVNDDATYYHFLLGVLHSVDPILFIRWINLTYGATTINGGFITTGMIKSAGGDTYFDLNNGEIGGKITFRRADGTKGIVADLEEDFSTLTNYVNETLAGIDGKIDTWYYAYDPTLSNEPTTNWITNEVRDAHVNDLFYNTNTGKSYRYVKNGAVYSWQILSDSDIQTALALAALAKDTADHKRQIFVTTPVTPYNIGDLWADGTNIKRCLVERLTGAFNALDWDAASNYDNTVTTIDGGIVTSGRIQLAGSGGSILAGITGEGTADNSIRLWAGAGYDNRAVAPLRIKQSGEIEARKKIEVFNSSNIGMAGICGFNVSGDGPVVAFFGAPYANRNVAPCRINSDGTIISGSWSIGSGGITNYDGTAVIVAASGSGNNVTKAIIGANAVSSASGISAAAYFSSKIAGANNVGAIFEASGGLSNYAILALTGKALINESLINGKSTYKETLNADARLIDPSLYDFIVINGLKVGSTISAVKFTTPSRPIYNGKEIMVLQQNDSANLRILETVRGANNFDIAGGALATLVYADGFWYAAGVWDNTWT